MTIPSVSIKESPELETISDVTTKTAIVRTPFGPVRQNYKVNMYINFNLLFDLETHLKFRRVQRGEKMVQN